MSAIDTYLRNNSDYAAGFTQGSLPIPPANGIAIVACMDARLEATALLGLENGEAHVIRNAGGVVTDDVIRSLTISQRLLGTREIMLIHHTDCGSKYCSNQYQRCLSGHRFEVSMSGKGNFYPSHGFRQTTAGNGQFYGRNVLQIHQGRADREKPLGKQTPGRRSNIPVH